MKQTDGSLLASAMVPEGVATPGASPAPANGSPPVTLPRWKRVLFALILASAVYTVFELAAIWYLKAFRGYDGKHLYQYVFDPYKNILPAPNYADTRGIRHNAQGFRRSSEVARRKPPATYRIFLLGGSTAYGLGGLWPHLEPRYPVIPDSETIDAFLERELNARLPGVHVEVINAAISSTWTHHELIYVNQTILNYQPDMILFLDGFNDYFFDNEDHDQFADYSYGLPARAILGDPTAASLIYADAWWLFRKNALAHVLGRALRTLKLLLASRPPHAPVDVTRSLAGLHDVFPRSALKMHRRIGLILRDEGVRAVFMLQPMVILEGGHKPLTPVEQRLFDFNVTSYRPNHDAFIRAAVPFMRDQEQQMAKQVGATYLDLTTIYGATREQAYTDYCHLTPLGNAILAHHVADRILPMIQRDRPAARSPSPGGAPASPDPRALPSRQ
jgi:lysophospholipase L1-like esterase